MIKLQDSQIAQILPEYFSKKAEVQALSFALYRAVARLTGYCGNISVFSVIDESPGPVLDLLAIELDAQNYEDTLEIGIKRQLIKNAMLWHITLGTPSAVDGFVATKFGDARIEEWYEYGGQPHYFRIAVDVDKVPGSSLKKIMKELAAYKRLSAHLEAFNYTTAIDHSFLEQFLLFKLRIGFIMLAFSWDCRLLNGGQLLDGQYLLDAEKNYNIYSSILVSGCRFITPEFIDVGKQTLNIGGDFSKEKKRLSLNDHFGVNYWNAACWKAERKAYVKINAGHAAKECRMMVCVTIRKNLWFLDGTRFLDGQDILNAENKKEEL